MSACERYARTGQPRPIAALTRPELAGRVQTLRDVIDALFAQSGLDRGPAFNGVGQLKLELYALEALLRDRDRQAPFSEPLPVA
ncbi:MAG: hypothetical protein M3Q37_11255, partial [Gemmatimonadota bacterium]|nr:hypothetical protein [Gemmatimonadota bacterium]